MKYDFPDNPVDGDTFAPPGGPIWRWNGTVWLQAVAAGEAVIALIGDLAPPNPAHGQLWWESDTGKLFIWYNDGSSAQWVEAVGREPFGESIAASPSYADDAAAAAGGVPVGGFYRTGSAVMVRVS